ncbi:MAG: DnaB-like helicase N-terminal domain-containing protein, partial [Oscillospiraceae bacterium]
SLSKIFAQQQIMAALLRDNGLFEKVNSQLTEKDFTDGNMRAAFEVYKKLKSENEDVSYALLCHYLEDGARKDLAKINATNADILIKEADVQMHIDNLKSAPLQRQDIKQTSVEDLAQRIQNLKERKK